MTISSSNTINIISDVQLMQSINKTVHSADNAATTHLEFHIKIQILHHKNELETVVLSFDNNNNTTQISTPP